MRRAEPRKRRESSSVLDQTGDTTAMHGAGCMGFSQRRGTIIINMSGDDSGASPKG